MTGPSRLLAGVALALGCGLLDAGSLGAQLPADSVLRGFRACPAIDSLPISPTPFPWIQSMLPEVPLPVPMPNYCGQRSASGVVRIRGARLPATAEPSYYVDGRRVTAAEFGLLRPEQIQSIQLLRGSPLLAKYGIEDPTAAVLATTRPAVAPDGAPQ